MLCLGCYELVSTCVVGPIVEVTVIGSGNTVFIYMVLNVNIASNSDN